MAIATVAVIGRCACPGCRRPAAVHLDVCTPGGRRLRGAVCERCERASRAAGFLLDLLS